MLDRRKVQKEKELSLIIIDLWSDHIASAEDYKAQLSEKTKGLTGSNCLVTIEFPTASAGIASVLRAGSIVDVYEDGTVAETHYSAGGTITRIKVTVSDEALETAQETGEVMPAPVTLPAGQSAAAAPVIHVEMPAVANDTPVGALPRLAISVTGAGETTVAFVRSADGSWTPVKDSYVADGRLIVPVEGPCELVIADNAKRFPDVAEDPWYAPSVAFVTARGIFNGTDRGFEPEGTMTRAQVAKIVQVFLTALR